MTKPTRFLIRMAAFLVVVLIIAGLLSSALETAFVSNPLLNTLILIVLLTGVGWTITQVSRLTPEVQWVETFQTARAKLVDMPPPRLLAPMASMLATRQMAGREGRFTLSAPAMRSILDGLSSRLDEGREISRYLTGLLIFLGLLGTFWGLLLTVASVSDVISGMTVGSGDLNALFEQLKTGLGRPLKGMGTAFSASMFGLSGALVLGFLDLTAGQAQNRFFNELEEWLASLTRLSSRRAGGRGRGIRADLRAGPARDDGREYGAAAIGPHPRRGRAHPGQQCDHRTVGQDSDAVGHDAGEPATHACGIAESQAQLVPALQRLGETRRDDTADAARAHLRNIEQSLQRLLSESEQGRQQSTSELRNDIRVLTPHDCRHCGRAAAVMPRSRRRGASEELNPWPGYVDALSTLLMVIIFVLLVFVLAQAFLSVALTGRDRALDRLNRQVAELSDMLSLERSQAGELQLSTASLGRDLQAANAARDQLQRDVAGIARGRDAGAGRA